MQRQDATRVGPAPWAQDILAFWFDQLGDRGWWNPSDIVDRVITDRFGELWEAFRQKPATDFLGRADEALAAIILFDQFPRQMFRGRAAAFATDPLAIEIAHAAVARGYDTQIGGKRRLFFYMPFQHSEALEDQQLSLKLFEALGQVEPLDFARRHHAIIARFGRFPHRNAALGRTDRPGEEEAIREGAQW